MSQDTHEDGTEDARSSEEDQPLPKEESALPSVVLEPPNDESFKSLTKLYKSMVES